MIKKLEENDEKMIENYIGNEYYKCIYLYLDYKKYGNTDPNIKSWIQTNNSKVNAIILMYYSGMHIYSRENDYNIKEIEELVYKEKPTMICAEQSIIRRLYAKVSIKGYNIEEGWVRELSQCDEYDSTDVETAKVKKDFEEIANLLYNDKGLGSSYKLNELEEQIYERNKTGYGRSYIIKQNNKIIAHAATGAENEKMAMLALVITDPNYRGKGYALKVCLKLCTDLLREGKKVYLINYSNESTQLYNKIGFKICCNWGKLYINLKK